jgi:hypothetical protein
MTHKKRKHLCMKKKSILFLTGDLYNTKEVSIYKDLLISISFLPDF